MEKDQELWYENFKVYLYKGKVVEFEANSSALINEVVFDVIKFLRVNNIDGQYTLTYGGRKLQVSKKMAVHHVVDAYVDGAEFGL